MRISGKLVRPQRRRARCWATNPREYGKSLFWRWHMDHCPLFREWQADGWASWSGDSVEWHRELRRIGAVAAEWYGTEETA